MSSTRLQKLRNRRTDPILKLAESRDVAKFLAGEDSAVQYAIGSMQPIDPSYTQRTIEERQRVENQLHEGYGLAGLSVTFDYQGSVTNDTHIRAYSDVDLLTVDDRSYRIEPPNRPAVVYQGDPILDLKEIRSETIKKLRASYPEAVVDDSGGKAVNISGGSLRRKVDVIACSWWHTVEYVSDQRKHWLGIQVLDNDNGARIPNKPFLHNKRIDDRDVAMNGGMRKLIRLLKSLKYDSDDQIEISSYDISGIVYNMPDDLLRSHPGYDVNLVMNCLSYLQYLEKTLSVRNAMDVPNGTRKVFCTEGASEQGLRQITKALYDLYEEIGRVFNRTSRKLGEARIDYH